jgi:hypothetical protein
MGLGSLLSLGYGGDKLLDELTPDKAVAPRQPTYNEGMLEALEAQVALLSGKKVGEADFRGVGKLEDLVKKYEGPLRKTTAQIDTDVMRQTLLGSEKVADELGRIQIGHKRVNADSGEEIDSVFSNYNGRVLNTNTGEYLDPMTHSEVFGDSSEGKTLFYSSEDGPRFTEFGANALQEWAKESGNDTNTWMTQGGFWTGGADNRPLSEIKKDARIDQAFKLSDAGTGASGIPKEIYEAFVLDKSLDHLNNQLSDTGSAIPGTKLVPAYQTDSDGNVIADITRAGKSIRMESGMVDLVGDSRAIKSATKQDDYESYVRDNEGNMAAFQAENARRTGAGEATLSVEQWGKAHYEASGKAAGDEMPTKYGYAEEDPGRRAGFDPTGEFLGLSAFGEDIQAQNLSRQRQRDLEDVARLSPLYSDIMDKYKPGTQQALEDARGVLKAREGAMTGAGGSLSDASTQVRESYLRVLGREPDAAGLASWTEALQNGASVEDMNLAFAEARAAGDAGPVMEGRLQAQARSLGRAASGGLDTGTAITASTGTAPTGYGAAAVGAPGALTADTGYGAASAAAIDPLSAATGYKAQAGLSSGRVGGDYEATRTISTETQTPLEFKNQGYMANALRDYQSGGGGSTMVGDVRVNNEEEFYNEFAKAMKVDVPYDTFKRGYTTGTEDIQSRGTGDIRAALMEDAYTGLGEGLTAREQENIEQASRRRATALGRTFDRGSIADEVQSRVLEDRNRQAQNRQYAQQVLGQEAQMQTSDMGRNLQAQMQNQAAANQAAQYGVGAGLQREQAGAQFAQQKALSDQQAANQAAQYGVGAGMQQESLSAQMAQQKAMADAQAANQAAQYGVGAGLQQQQFGAGQDIAAQAMNREAAMKASEFDILQSVARGEQNIGRELAAAESDLDRDYRQRFSQEQLAQQGTLGYIDAATRLAALEDTSTLDPFQAVLGRTGGGSLQSGQGVFGQAQYGLQSGPQYLKPESGLGFIQNQAVNQANMYNTQQSADAIKRAAMLNMFGNVATTAATAAACWVAREVYGAHNPAWLDFRHWMFNSAPRWFFKLYLTFGERFANFISNKPRLKARIRMWMDTKIGR